MRLAIVGLSGSGKSTLFRAVTGSDPGVTSAREPAVSVVRVPDPRLEYLRTVFSPRKYTPVAIEVRDFPGLPEPGDITGAKIGELLAAAREADGLLICVRGFEEPTYPYAHPVPDPAREADHVATELAFADLDVAVRRIEKLDRKGGNMVDAEKQEHAALVKVSAALEAGRPVKEAGLNKGEEKILRGFRFLTEKPWVLVVSLPDEGGDVDVEGVPGAFEARIGLRSRIEAEVAELPEEDRGLFMEDLGLEELAAAAVVRTAFEGLGTISFFTTGEDEVRAWPVTAGTRAVDAAGEIHTDLSRGFIRAEVYTWDEFHAAGGDEAAIKKAGRFRLEGKDYVVQDGDIFHVRFSV